LATASAGLREAASTIDSNSIAEAIRAEGVIGRTAPD
jgi:hypothetical protein